MKRVLNCLNVLFKCSAQIFWADALLRLIVASKHLPETVSTSVILGMCILRMYRHTEREMEGGLRGGERGQGSTVGGLQGGFSIYKALIREGIMEVYLHQLSARLLGWRRSWDPPAILLELPAGNNQSHCYSRSCPDQLDGWPDDQDYSL